MTALESHIQNNRLSEVETMNRLQGEGGIISDECTWAADVPATDAAKAVEWIKKQDKLEKGELNL
jgi:hypothetical protein